MPRIQWIAFAFCTKTDEYDEKEKQQQKPQLQQHIDQIDETNIHRKKKKRVFINSFF